MIDSSEEGSFVQRTLVNVGIISMFSYFEAFCKNNFAAILNCCPSLIENIKDLKVVRDNKKTVNSSIGFYISDGLSFDNFNKVRGLYTSLLKQDFFTESQLIDLQRIKNTRNIIVHHGGFLNSKYKKKDLLGVDRKFSRLFLDSLELKKKDFFKCKDLLEQIVIHMKDNSKQSLLNLIKKDKILLPQINFEAIDRISDYLW